MKIKITTKGSLEIERVGTFIRQYCPFTQDRIPCGDWCPLFDDTRLHIKSIPYLNTLSSLDLPELDLCQKTYSSIDEVIDERNH